jgi:hypothetical protein
MKPYDHLVHIDEATREVVIYRVDAEGRRSLYTRAPLPSTEEWKPEVDAFAKLLGENLLMDSPAARKLLNL